MNKDTFFKHMTDYGDAVITYVSPVSKKSKYVVATKDFASSSYISNRKQPKSVPSAGKVLLFCWDTDTFKHIDISAVERVESLNKIVTRGDSRDARGNIRGY